MNSTNLTGRHSKEPELRYTNNGTAVCNFTLAVRNPYNKENNVDFIPCVAWGAAAELVAEKHVTGNMMGITGRIQTRSYQNDEDRTIYVTEVNASEIHLIQTKDYEENRENYNNGSNSNTSGNGKGSNNQQNKNNNRNKSNQGNQGNRNNRNSTRNN